MPGPILLAPGKGPGGVTRFRSSELSTELPLSVGSNIAPTYPVTADLVGGTGTRSFSAVTTLAGDYLVVEIIVENNDSTASFPVTATGLTFTIQNDVNNVTQNSHTRLFQVTAPDSAGGSRTVTITPNTAKNYRGRLTVVRGSAGIGNKAIATAAQTVSLTRSADNSGIFMAVGDWNAGAVGSPVWTPGGSTVASELVSGTATYIFGRWNDSGVAGIANHGISSPSYTTPSSAALEMLGMASGFTNVMGSAAFTDDMSLVATASITSFGDTALSSTTTLTVSGVIVQSGSSALSADSTLTVTGSVIVQGISALSGQSNLSTIGSNLVLPIATLTGQSTLSVSATITELPSASLSGQSTLTSVGIVTKLGSATLSGQSTLTANGTVTGSGSSATLSGQSTLNVSATVTALPLIGLSGQSTLTSVGTLSRLGSISLSGSSTLSVSGTVIEVPVISLSGQSTLTASGTIGSTGLGASLSAQSTLTVIGSVIVKASSGLSGQSSLAVNGLNTTLANVNLSGQSTMSVSGSNNVRPVISFNSQSTLTVSGTIGAVPVTAFLSANSTLNAIGRVTTTATVSLSSITSLGITEVVKQFVSANLAAQSSMNVNGFIPVKFFGTANLSVISDLQITVEAHPPWTFPYIEFSAFVISNTHDGATSVVSKEGKSGKIISRDGSSSVSSIEGG